MFRYMIICENQIIDNPNFVGNFYLINVWFGHTWIWYLQHSFMNAECSSFRSILNESTAWKLFSFVHDLEEIYSYKLSCRTLKFDCLAQYLVRLQFFSVPCYLSSSSYKVIFALTDTLACGDSQRWRNSSQHQDD